MLTALALVPFLASTLVLERGAIVPGYGRYLAVEDTVLDSSTGEVPQGGAAALLVNSTKPVLIQFLDLQRAVGKNKRVTKASLEFVITSGTPKFAGIRRVLQPWTEGPLNTIAGQLRGDDFGVRWAATYKNRRGGIDAIPWAKPAARGDTDSEPIAGATATVVGDKLTISGLESAVQTQLNRWYDNNGFLIEFDDKVDFFSSISSEGRPKLTLELADAEPAKGPDLSVTLISRTPEYERYDDRNATTVAEQDGVAVPLMDKVPNATGKKWPDEGEKLLYIAHVKNVGDAPASGFEAQWLDRELGASIVAVDKKLAPGEETTLQVELPYRSSHSDHRVQPIALRLFPKGVDANRQNDFLEIQQSALALGVTVTPEAAAKLGQPVEDWVQGEIRRWNEVTSRYSRYSFAPDGSLERVRVQQLTVGTAPAGASLLLDGEIVIQEPGDLTAHIARACGLSPLTTDGLKAGSVTADGTRVRPSIDRFAGVAGGGDVRADAFLVPSMSFPYDVFSDLTVDPARLDPGEALSATDVRALNSNLGRRRGYIGDYFYDAPGSVLLTLTDMSGKRIANTDVTVYQMKNGSFAGTSPIAQIKTGEQGSLILPKREVLATPGFYFATGHTPTANPFGRIDPDFRNGALLFKATVNGVTETGVLKLWQVLDSAARIRRPVALLTLKMNVPSVPLEGGNAAQGKTCNLPSATDGDPGTATSPLDVVEIDLGQDRAIGEVSVVTQGSGQWAFDIMVYGSGEKPESARLYAREGDLAWSRLCRSESDGWIAYRSLPQKARFIRIVSKRPAEGVKLAEVLVRVAK